jgi:4-hydroxy-tetrahydrodipicolinate synthase
MSFTRRQFLVGSAGVLVAGDRLNACHVSRGLSEVKGPQFIIAALAALNRRGQIDAGLVRDYLNYLSVNGVQTILVNGTTGEFASFSVLERKWALQTYLRHRGALRVMCHVGANNVRETIELLRHAECIGVEAALVLPPFYFKNNSVDGLAAFFEPVLEASRIPVMLYNIPQLSGVSIPVELVRRLARHPRLYGVKDSWGKPAWTAAYIRAFPKLKIFTGASALVESVLAQGGGGALTGNGNIFPRETASVFQAHLTGTDTAGPQKHLNERVALMKSFPVIPTMKFLLREMGVADMRLRPPLVELTQEQKAELRTRFQQAGLLS